MAPTGNRRRGPDGPGEEVVVGAQKSGGQEGRRWSPSPVQGDGRPQVGQGGGQEGVLHQEAGQDGGQEGGDDGQEADGQGPGQEGAGPETGGDQGPGQEG